MKKKALFITLTAKPGKRDLLWKKWQELLIPQLKDIPEAKNIVPCFDCEDCDVIRLFELFDDETVPEQIISSGWFKNFQSEVEPILKNAKIKTATPMWEK